MVYRCTHPPSQSILFGSIFYFSIFVATVESWSVSGWGASSPPSPKCPPAPSLTSSTAGTRSTVSLQTVVPTCQGNDFRGLERLPAPGKLRWDHHVHQRHPAGDSALPGLHLWRARLPVLKIIKSFLNINSCLISPHPTSSVRGWLVN